MTGVLIKSRVSGCKNKCTQRDTCHVKTKIQGECPLKMKDCSDRSTAQEVSKITCKTLETREAARKDSYRTEPLPIV